MTPLSQKILDQYQIRKTNKQKKAFIELLQNQYPDLQVQESKFLKCRNLVLGDPESAEVILTAHYDTCAQLPVPNFITPKAPLLTILYGILLALPLMPLVILVEVALILALDNSLIAGWIAITLYLGLLALVVLGPANKHTANDNTSGVITLCELIDRLTDEQKRKVAFVFFDHEETGLIGSSLFRKKYKEHIKDKLLINFDCVSDGDYFLLAATKKARQTYGEQFAKAFVSTESKTVMLDSLEKVYYPSDHAGYPVALAAAALKKNKVFGYYMDRIHTSKDTIFDETNIDTLCSCVQRFLELI